MNSKTIKKSLPYQSKGDLTTGPVFNHLIRLSVPMMWGIFSIISVQVVDVYFIARLGTQELAAISFVFPVMLVLTHFSFGFSIAMASVISRLIGEKKQGDVRRVVKHGMMLSFSVSTIIAALAYMLSAPLFTAMGADGASVALINDYFPYWLLTFVVMALPVNGNSALRANGDALRPAFVMVTIALVNLVLDPIMIFGLFDFPAMGVKGAALATLLAHSVGGVLGLWFLMRNKDIFHLPSGLHLNLFGNSLKRLIVIAIPAGIANIIVPFTNTIIVGALAVHGAQAVAAHGIANRVEAVALITVISLAVGMTPVIGQNWGAGLYKRVSQVLRIALGFNMVWSLVIAALLYSFARPVAEIFSSDEGVITYAILFFKIVPVSYAFGNLVLGWSSSFNAMGRPVRALVMMATHAALLISSVLLGNYYYGVEGLLYAIVATNITAGIFFHILSVRACRKSAYTA